MLSTAYSPTPIHTTLISIQTPAPINTPVDISQNCRKEIANVAKIYIKKQKYGGTNKSLNYKLIIFYDICN